MIGAAEAQRVQIGNRPGAHGEDVAQDAADAGGRALIRLDERRVVVALHFEDRGVAVADVDDAGVLAGAADDALTGGRQLLEPDLRRFVRTVLRPHHRKDAELGEIRRAAHDAAGALEFVLGKAELPRLVEGRRGFRAGVRTHAKASASEAKKPWPPVEPSSGSVAFSGCGINPRTLRPSFRIPAIARAEPLSLASSTISPASLQ